MANDFEVSVDIQAPPDAVWDLVGDPARVPEWFPAVVACRVEGDERRVTTAQGLELVERLLERDDAARTYAYSVVAGNPALTSHRASLSVLPVPGGGSRVVWRQAGTSDREGFGLERRLSGVMADGLAHLKSVLDGGGP
jgi:hypothetical protein